MVDYTFSKPCENSHNFTWYGSNTSPSEKVPDGTICDCGMFIVHHDKCPCCGNEITKTIPIEEEK